MTGESGINFDLGRKASSENGYDPGRELALSRDKCSLGFSVVRFSNDISSQRKDFLGKRGSEGGLVLYDRR